MTGVGEAGRNVVRNVEHLRRVRSLSLRGLSERLGELGRPILPSVLHNLSQGNRRVDADDLVALATVLKVTPADLLMPPGEAGGAPVQDHPALRAGRNLVACLEVVAAAGDASPGDPATRSLKRALKRVRLEVGELLEEHPSQAEGS